MTKKTISKFLFAFLIIIVVSMSVFFRPFKSQYKYDILSALNVPAVMAGSVLVPYEVLHEIDVFTGSLRFVDDSRDLKNDLLRRYMYLQSQGYRRDNVSFKKNQFGPDTVMWINAAQSKYLVESISSAPYFDSVRQKATEVQQALDSGRLFSDVARQYSDDRSSKDVGGLVGFVDETSIDPEIIDKLDASLVGKIQKIVTSRGIFFVRLKSVNEKANPKSYEIYVIHVEAKNVSDFLNSKYERVRYRKLFFDLE